MSYKTNLLVSTPFQVTMNLNFYKFDLFIECSLGRCDVSLLANETCERPKQAFVHYVTLHEEDETLVHVEERG